MELRSFNEDVESKALLEKLSAAKRAELLQLRNCRLEGGMWSRLAEGKCRVRQLKLDYTNMNGNMADLAKCVTRFGVEELSLIWTKLQNADLRIFKTDLEGQRGKIQLNHLCFMHVRFDSIGCEILAQILCLLPDMEELDITNCGLTDDTVQTFHDCILSEKKIARLRLARNQKITAKGMLIVRKLLEKCRIEMIDISRCELTGDHLKSLSEKTENIKELILHGNPSLSSRKILQYLSNWKNLEKIEVSECWLEQEDLETLRQGPWKACEIIDKGASASKTVRKVTEMTEDQTSTVSKRRRFEQHQETRGTTSTDVGRRELRTHGSEQRGDARQQTNIFLTGISKITQRLMQAGQVPAGTPGVNEEVKPNLASKLEALILELLKTELSRDVVNLIRMSRTEGSDAPSPDSPKLARKDQASTPQFPFGRLDLIEQSVDNYFVEELAEEFTRKSMFNQAITLLHDLPATQRQQMILAECYFEICRDDQAFERIENIKTLIARCPRLEAIGVYILGLASFKKSYYIKAMISFACAAKHYLARSNSANADETIRGIQICAFRLHEVILEMVVTSTHMLTIAFNLGMRLMQGITEDVWGVENATPDLKAGVVAGCLANFGGCHHLLSNSETAIACYGLGVAVMITQFRENSPKYNLFGFLLSNFAIELCDKKLGKYSEAAFLFELAIAAQKIAEDWENDEAKRIVVTKIEGNLRYAHSQMNNGWEEGRSAT